MPHTSLRRALREVAVWPRTHVVDLTAGSSGMATALLPAQTFTLVDTSADRLAVATLDLRDAGHVGNIVTLNSEPLDALERVPASADVFVMDADRAVVDRAVVDRAVVDRAVDKVVTKVQRLFPDAVVYAKCCVARVTAAHTALPYGHHGRWLAVVPPVQRGCR